MNNYYLVVTNMRGIGTTRRMWFNANQLWKAKLEAKENHGHVYDIGLRMRVF
jgi:hypothetical protein